MARWETYREGDKVVTTRSHPIMAGFFALCLVIAIVSTVAAAPWLIVPLGLLVWLALGITRNRASRDGSTRPR